MLHQSKMWVLLVALWSTMSAAHAASPFVGRWSGGWHDTTLGQAGTLEFKVRPNGAFGGRLQNNSGSLNGSWTGSISDRGAIQADYAYTSGDKAGAGSTSFRAVGTLHRNDTGHLVGRLAFVRGEQPFDYADFDLVRQNDAPVKPARRSPSRRRHSRHRHRATPTPPFPTPLPAPALSNEPDAVVLYDPYDLAAPLPVAPSVVPRPVPQRPSLPVGHRRADY